MKILYVNTHVHAGGAELISYSLFIHHPTSYLAVKFNGEPIDRVISLKQGFLVKVFAFLNKLKWRFKAKYSIKKLLAIEDKYNHTFQNLKKLKEYKEADIIHLHNIHGDYFDLDAIEIIAKEKKIIWTLHDMWSMTGGEAYTFENENYKIGIGKTPYLNVPPLNGTLVDNRQKYLEQKKSIYKNSSENITFISVSKWLESCFRQSYVFNEKLKIKTIYNGFDDDVFYPKNRTDAQNCRILIFNSKSPFKGSEIFKSVIESITTPFELYIIGDAINIQNEKMLNVTVQPYLTDRKLLAKLYNSVDVLIFPSKAEAFGLIPVEAMACGVCVFASNIGGIPEIIEDKKNGFLFNSTEELCNQLNQTISDKTVIKNIGKLAAEDVKRKFPIKRMLDEYEKLYQETIQK